MSGALAINCIARGRSHRHRQRTSSSSLADDHRNDRHDERVALVLAGDGSLLRHREVTAGSRPPPDPPRPTDTPADRGESVLGHDERRSGPGVTPPYRHA